MKARIFSWIINFVLQQTPGQVNPVLKVSLSMGVIPIHLEPWNSPYRWGLNTQELYIQGPGCSCRNVWRVVLLKKSLYKKYKTMTCSHRQCGHSVWSNWGKTDFSSSLPLKKWVCSSQLQTPDFLMTYRTALAPPPSCLYQAMNLSLAERNYKEKNWEEKSNQRNAVREKSLLSQYYFLA